VISPKLVEVGRHLNIELLTNTELLDLEGEPGNFSAKIHREPRFVDLSKCTSCGDCAKVCPIELSNDYDEGLSTQKAIYKQYAQAIPGAFAIQKRGTAPCKATCPAHVSIQGYIALINAGKNREALELFKQEHPFPGICGRVCHHPCEEICTRNDLDQPLAIRELHRYLADYERDSGEMYIPEVAESREEKVAVIGSGPAGLTTAYDLAQKGYQVTIFEKLPVAGGMMMVGIPEYRLPRDILAGEIKVIEQLGVTIKTGVTFGKDITLESLKADGFSAVFLAVGLHGGRKLGVENEDAQGVLQGVDYLRDSALGKDVSIGKDVLVIGGGNVAIDVALTAKRKGAENVTLICLESRDEMPAWEQEIEEALEGEIKIANSFGPKAFFIDKSDRVSGIEFKACTAVFDTEGRFSPQYNENECQPYFGDTIIIAIGQSAQLDFAQGEGIEVTPRGGIQVDPVTLQTSTEWVFAGGDVFYGPKSVVDAVSCGKEAAESIHRFLNGQDLAQGREQNWEFEKPDISLEPKRARTTVRCLDPEARECNFLEVSFGYNEQEAKQEADRCLRCGICSECYQCVNACLAGAVDHSQTAVEEELRVGSVILSQGADVFDPGNLEPFYHWKSNPNVMTSLEFERILSASGPTLGHLERPSDGKDPKKIAWLQCVGSRDTNRCGNGYCSSVCCMYAVKESMIAKEHAHGDLDCAVFNMDIRTFGKDYEKYYLRARDKEGVRFVKARIHTIEEIHETGDLRLHWVDDAGQQMDETFDMVVLSVGLQVTESSVDLAKRLNIDLGKYNFAKTDPFLPVATSRKGVYTCGIFQGPKDIPSAVTEAGAAASAAAVDLAGARNTETKKPVVPDEIDVSGTEPRVGVFVCNCGINIGGVVDVPAVKEYAATLPNVVFTDENLFTCSQDTQDKIKEKIKEHNLNRLVVAACTPKTHEPIFQETLEGCGLNKYLFEMANIRNQNSWIHSKVPETATKKAKDLIRMAVARAETLYPLKERFISVNKRALVIGGGVAGMNAALNIGRQGFKVFLVEQDAELGGMAKRLHHTIEGKDIPGYLEQLRGEVGAEQNVEVLAGTRIVGFSGYKGNFSTEVTVGDETEVRTLKHGVIIVATGATEYIPIEYQYPESDRVVTQVELSDHLSEKGASDLSSVVMIQCVGSRNEQNQNCSRICCQSAVKNALEIKKLNPDAQVFVLNRDIRTYGLLEDYYTEAREKGVIFIRFDPESPPVVTTDNGNLMVSIKDHILQRDLEIESDMVALSAGVVAQDTESLSRIMKLNRNPEGFFMEAHVKLRPVDMGSEGVFLCGTAHGPKLLTEAIAQAQAAVARATTFLSKSEIKLSAITAKVDTDHCVKCLTCVRSCPFQVPVFNTEMGEVEIDDALCRGCGVCTAVCPREAIKLSFYENDQLICKIEALLAEEIE
jgi:heterodisulfide reductase subunit A-like polyferredoxin